MDNIKTVLNELGNRLVEEYHFHPGWECEPPTVAPIVDFLNWLKANPQAQAVLKEMGVEWQRKR